MSSHYLNQCWNIVTWAVSNKLQLNVNQNSYIFIQENPCENVVRKLAAILSRPQCVNWSVCNTEQRCFVMLFYIPTYFRDYFACCIRQSNVNKLLNILHVNMTGEWILDKEDAHHCLLDHIMDFPIDSLYAFDGLGLMINHRVKCTWVISTPHIACTHQSK